MRLFTNFQMDSLMRLHMDNLCETVDQLSIGQFNETPYGLSL